MKELSIKQYFIQFLMKRGAFAPFYKNLKDPRCRITPNWQDKNPGVWVGYSIRWSLTPEKREYWASISRDWEKFYNLLIRERLSKS